MNVGYIAFYKGKTYRAFDEYKNGFIFHDEYAKTHQLNWSEINKFFDRVEELLESEISS